MDTASMIVIGLGSSLVLGIGFIAVYQRASLAKKASKETPKSKAKKRK